MPYIKKIEVNGFKTFGKKTTLTFDKGFTVITGPNGSGKTNIMDAILFCLGELSVKRLRAENFAGLIYKGNSESNVKNKGKAKVTIQFDNGDGHIPIDTSTITISREIDQNGQSIYRLNGRKVSRTYLMDTLSLASISPYGHNIVLQGTLTRLAEISSVERRKIIEDLIGIGQYDAEKAEAQTKLDAANVAIKTAMGQIGEVQKRIESLEKERNDLLRSNLIQNEIRLFEAVKLSNEIGKIQEKIRKISTEITVLEERISKIREEREALRAKRRCIEDEWRRSGLEKIEEGQTRLLKIQIEIGEIRSRITEISTKISSARSFLHSLIKLKEENSAKIESLKKEITMAEERIKELTDEQDRLVKEIEAKEKVYNDHLNEASRQRMLIQERSERKSKIEERIDNLRREIVAVQKVRSDSKSKIDVYDERIRNLEEKKDEITSLIGKLEESLSHLIAIQNDQASHLSNLQSILEKEDRRKKSLESELKEAAEIAEIASEAYVEFETRKNLIRQINTEEETIRHIEELGKMGVIEGIHGRLRNLVRIKKGYEKAVEAAAAGWLESLIVRDLSVAFTCAETLKRLKLGRIKIIPLQGITPRNNAVTTMNSGIDAAGLERIVNYVEYSKEYEPAIHFVLGDTLLARNERDAIEASRRGYRSVTLNGDLYEAGGGVESGFFRAPIDLSSLVPSEATLKALDRAVSALKEVLTRRSLDIEEMEARASEIQKEITKIAESLGTVKNEVERTKKSIQQSKANLSRIEKNIDSLRSLKEEEKRQVEECEKRLSELAAEEEQLRKELEDLRNDREIDGVHLKEEELESLRNELMSLKEKLGTVRTDISSIRSRIDDVLKVMLENAVRQVREATNRISITEREIDESTKEKENLLNEIKKREEEKEMLLTSLINAKEQTKSFAAEMEAVDTRLGILDKEYEETDKLLDELRLNLQTLNLQASRHIEQLRDLGYNEPLMITPEQVEEAEMLIRQMKLELASIGAVNQLALSQYDEQISRYKELSLRMNEMEKEKIAIENFIQEIEKKKYDAFMEAYNKINDKIDRYFSRLTGGGKASLRLENPDNPFEGGVDMVVQFVGKPPILVSGASSGERSVSAVAFLFSLQEFSPASFYLFDEIDAHLDAFHVERLGELLAEESDKCQFIVITLKPEMVSKADRIYGVYGHQGMSQVVSTTFKGKV
ncbi:MAG: chromosome segregation SMC family protein [Nitrososphaerota archaeon]|nr:chromosome segregation SMC family protein [Nitrososphaerota archaeon]